jgi:septal ring factor EnvC (AmiA/AmiB activator)
MHSRFLLAVFAAIPILASCTTAYYRALETVGIEKRDILVDRVEEARDSQADAKEQFTSALDRYRSVVNIDGGDLEEIYDRLAAEFERSEASAQAVDERVAALESVAADLFDEWEDEIDQYSDAGLRRQSQQLLTRTRGDYGRLMAAMQRAGATMDPVLTLFRDQVLFLRHNLNARAIGSLETELADIERATASLIEEMERAIAEASRFIEALA